MGLDIVEFIMDIEDEFDIRIDDADSYSMCTCRNTAEYILTHLPAAKLQTQCCITQSQFYLMRKRLMQDFHLPRQSIRSNTLLKECLKGKLKPQWNKLKTLPEFSHLPPLECSQFLRFATSSIIALTIFFALSEFTLLHSVPTLLITLLLWGVTLVFTPALFANKIPAVYQTLGGLARTTRLTPFPLRLNNSNHQTSSQNTDLLLYEHTLKRVTRIASKILCVPEEKISPDAHLIHDLGMD